MMAWTEDNEGMVGGFPGSGQEMAPGDHDHISPGLSHTTAQPGLLKPFPTLIRAS